MITGAATEVPLGAGAIVRAGHIGGGRDGPDPVRRGRVSNIARKGPGRHAAAEGARPGPLPGPRRDRRAGHDVKVPGLVASRPRSLPASPRRRFATWLYVIKFLGSTS